MANEGRKVAGRVIGFSVVIFLLFLLGNMISAGNTFLMFIQGVFLTLSYTLFLVLIGSILHVYGKKLAAGIAGIIGFWTAFFFLFNFFLLPGMLTAGESVFIFPLFLLEESLVWAGFASRMMADGVTYYGGLTLTRLSRSLFIVSIFFASLAYGPTVPFSYFFIPVIITTVVFSFTPVLMSSRGEFTATMGRYFARTSDRYISLSLFLGILLALYVFPKPSYLNNYIILVFLVLAILAILRIAWKTYSSTASKIWKTSEDIYSRHNYKEVLLPDSSIDSVMGAVGEFTGRGDKEKLLITLTMILTNSGYSVEECNDMLRSLISYKMPDPLIFKSFAIRSRLEREVRVRNQIVNEIVSHISPKGAGS